jgi:hypothetical protein
MINRYPMKNYPTIGVCGLDCGLCPRFHTEGKVKCPGCCGLDFYDRHPACGLVNCCVRQRDIESCALCTVFDECPKIFQVIEAAQERDSFISYRQLPSNLKFIREHGIEEYHTKQFEQQSLLLKLLDKYDDGRSKLFYCTSCQLIPIKELQVTFGEVERKLVPDAELKERSRLMRGTINHLAEKLQIDLKLRNKSDA